MNRRNFLSLAALAIAGKAAERVFPFRVYSIPKEIVVADPALIAQMNADMTAAWENVGVITNGSPYAIENYSGTFMNISRSEYPKASLYAGNEYLAWDGAKWNPREPQMNEQLTELQFSHS